jgi:hypothetical protein
VKAGSVPARVVLLALILPAASAGAGPLQLVGYSGYLGEWELTATVTEDGTTTPKGYSGPLSMKHVGLCTQDGPEEISGKIRVQMPPSRSRINATLWEDGIECGYQGVLSDFCTGTIDCSGRERVPLKLWIKESKWALSATKRTLSITIPLL